MKKTAILALCAVFVTVTALPVVAAGENVTFTNKTGTTQYVLAVWGGGTQCTEMTERVQLTVEPGESAVVESGESSVCWCSSASGKVGDCRASWSKTKAGKELRLR